MKIAALQWDVRRGEVGFNLAAARAGLERARDLGVALVLLPEMWATSFPDAGADLRALEAQARAAAQDLAQLGARLQVDWAGSGFAFESLEGEGAHASLPANRLEVYAGAQRILAFDKLHLFGPTAEDRVFRGGARLPGCCEWRGLKLSGVVCYDLRFPEATRAPFRAGAELLLVPAQWPTPRAGQWRALVHGLAASGQCFVLACNRNGRERVARRGLELEFPGNSLIVGPGGETLAEGRGEDGLLVATIDPAQAREWQERVPVRADLRPEIYGP